MQVHVSLLSLYDYDVKKTTKANGKQWDEIECERKDADRAVRRNETEKKAEKRGKKGNKRDPLKRSRFEWSQIALGYF